MVEIVEILRHECFYNPAKTNMVVDSLSVITMGSVSSVEEGTNDLVKMFIGCLN